MANEIVDDFFASDISGEIQQLEDECISQLKNEINSIKDKAIQSFTKAMLLKVELFWSVPSSNTPEYYPPDEAFNGGLLVHTKRVFRVVEILSVLYELDDADSDQLKSAALLHDITKPLSLNNSGYIYDYMHPYTVDALYSQVKHEDELHSNDAHANVLNIDKSIIKNIFKAIRCHKGMQSPIPETRPSKDSIPMLLHVANEIAKSLHYIVDGEEVILDRWIAMIDDGDQE